MIVWLPYKKRKLVINRPVFVYRNLNNINFKYSIKQNGLVVGHTNQIDLAFVKFIINEKGRQKVIREKRKNVHAYIKGYIITDPLKCSFLYELTRYDPYKHDSFIVKGKITRDMKRIDKATIVSIHKYGIDVKIYER